MEQREKVVLLLLDLKEYDVEESAEELVQLVEAAGGEVVLTAVQQREKPEKKTFFGKGKLLELQLLAEDAEADLAVVDAELSALQLRAIEELIGLPVIDRTTLILDIFAKRARTSEGKLQVELAALRYRLLRLAGSAVEKGLSRLGGGIGTRGPGEKKLETDRRHIRTRILFLEKKLKNLERRRSFRRERRAANQVPIVSLVGYTNVGKSSLLNSLTGADAFAEDRLFSTLDPTMRKWSVGALQQVVLVDTVGFVSRLPHHLVKAFYSTLEEMTASDLILKVIDASSPHWQRQLELTDAIIEQMGCGEIEQLVVCNKSDKVHDRNEVFPGILVSAKTKAGFDKLTEAVSHSLSSRVVRCCLRIPFTDLSLVDQIRVFGNVIEERYENDGLYLVATVDQRMYKKVAQYAC